MKLNLRTVGKITLAVVRVGGPIVTGVLGVVAGVKYDEAKKDEMYAIDDSDLKVPYEDLNKKQKFKVLAPIFAPVIISAGVTVFCTLYDKHLDAEALKEMTKAYSAAMISSMAYRKKLEEESPEAVKEVDEEIIEKTQKYPMLPWNEEPEESDNGGGGDELFVDSLTGRRFKSNIEAVSKALTACEKQYESAVWEEHLGDGNKGDVYGVWPTRYLAMNDVYHALGIEQTYFGQQFGYVGVYDKDYEDWDYCGEHIGFHLSDGPDGTHYIIYETMPMEGWYEI